jgi:hypothetical protein
MPRRIEPLPSRARALHPDAAPEVLAWIAEKARGSSMTAWAERSAGSGSTRPRKASPTPRTSRPPGCSTPTAIRSSR